MLYAGGGSHELVNDRFGESRKDAAATSAAEATGTYPVLLSRHSVIAGLSAECRVHSAAGLR